MTNQDRLEQLQAEQELIKTRIQDLVLEKSRTSMDGEEEHQHGLIQIQINTYATLRQILDNRICLLNKQPA